MEYVNMSGTVPGGYPVTHIKVTGAPDAATPLILRGLGHFYQRAGDEEQVGANEEPWVNVYWGIAGNGDFFANGKSYRLEPGDVFVILSNEPRHSRAVAKLWEYCWFVFDGALADQFVSAYGFPLPHFHAGAFPWDVFRRAENVLLDNTPAARREGVTVISSFLACAAGREITVNHANEQMNALLRLCNDRRTDPEFNINTLAAELHLNRATVQRLFAANLHITPVEYLMRLRMSLALKMLENPARRIAEIAELCGFSSVNYFCRAFRHAFGKSPGKFRRAGKFPPGGENS